MEINEKYNYLIDELGINEEVVNFATSIYGMNEETIDNIIWYYFGYETLEQYIENEREEI